jgi:ACS family tartrate transporter-like MFS transporter
MPLLPDAAPRPGAPPADLSREGSGPQSEAPAESVVGRRTRRRIARRLLPFLFILYIVAFMDRVNVAYAALEMTRALGFSARVFGFGAGIFFIGYFLLEIPGALLVEKWSARGWIARILISWGLVTLLVAFVKTAQQFYWARFFLGMAEAGFFPGIIVYLTHWFTNEDRGKAVALFSAAIPVSNIIGSPMAGLILGVHWRGLAGWQWIFILEGIPAVVFGVITLFYLTDRPGQARWLQPEEREWISRELEREKEEKKAAHAFTVWQALGHRDVVLLALVYFLSLAGGYGITFWMPTIIKRLSALPNLTVTLISGFPYLLGLGSMVWNGWSSDRSRERRWHAALPIFITGAALLLGVAAGSRLIVAILMFTIATGFMWTFMPPFWALPTALLSEGAAAASIGLINSVGNLGGFAGPYAVGFLQTAVGSTAVGMTALVACLAAAGLLVLRLKARRPASQTTL